MTKESTARVFILALLALSLYLLFRVFQPFMSAILWAIFLVTAFHPVYLRLIKWFRGYEWTAAILTTALIATLIVAPGTILVASLSDAASPLLTGLQSQLQAAPGAAPLLSKHPYLIQIETLIRNYIDISELKLHEIMVTTVGRLGENLSIQVQPLLENVLRTIMDFFVMIITMVFLFRQGPAAMAACRRMLPLNEKDKEAVFTRLEEVTRAIFYGVIMTAMIQALAGAAGWIIAGLPNPLIFGIAMFFCALIPLFGTALVWIPGAVYLFTHQSPGKALFLLLWGILVISMIDNFLKPMFISGKTRLHIVLVFFGIFGGLTAFGLKGLFLGPLVITLFMFIIEVVRRDLFPSEK